MASALYPLGKQALLSAGFNLLTDNIKAALVSTATYTYSAAHQFFSSITGVQGTPVQLTSPAVPLGVFNAGNATFSGVSGSAVGAVVLYKDTGTATTSALLAYIDGISVTPNGGDIIVAWDTGVSKIFAL